METGIEASSVAMLVRSYEVAGVSVMFSRPRGTLPVLLPIVLAE